MAVEYKVARMTLEVTTYPTLHSAVLILIVD